VLTESHSPKAIEHAPQQCRADADASLVGAGHDGIAQPQAVNFFERHGKHIPVAEADHLCADHPSTRGQDGAEIADRRRPFGEFDLRGDKGKFVPRKDAVGKEPLEVFVVAPGEPADAVGEYYRLTGKPVMPPKWVLGYMQSHRTLAGPDEPVAIAKTFRVRKLPCDAVIYLGTGYCPAGWNVGHGTFEFNPATFPRPADTIDALHRLNLRRYRSGRSGSRQWRHRLLLQGRALLARSHSRRLLFGFAVVQGWSSWLWKILGW